MTGTPVEEIPYQILKEKKTSFFDSYTPAESPSRSNKKTKNRASSGKSNRQTTDKASTLVLRLNEETHAPHLHVHGADRT
jgi:hypothetical protein